MSEPHQEEITADVIDLDFRYYFYLLRASWKLILATALIAGGIGFAITQFMTPIYRSTTTLFVDTRQNISSADYNTIRANESLARTYDKMIVSRGVLERAIEELDLASQSIGIGALRNAIEASSVSGTQLLRITVEDSNPERAAAIANTLTEVFIDEMVAIQTSGFASSQESYTSQLSYIESQITATELSLDSLDLSDTSNLSERNRLEGLLAEYNRQQTTVLQSLNNVNLQSFAIASSIQQFEKAVPTGRPVSPSETMFTLGGLLLGLATSVFFVLIRDFWDDTVKNGEELSKQIGLPILGQVLRFNAEEERLITAIKPRSPAAESFRSLRMNIKYASVDKPLKSILITSPAPSEGKTTLSSNLGVVMAASGDDVIILDGDLRRPNIHKAFDLGNPYGTSTLFIEDLDKMDEMVQDTPVEGLFALTSGPIPPNPSELLDTERAKAIVEHAGTIADKVIVDAPPIIALTDSLALSQHVDGVVLVVRPGSTKRAATKQAVNRLRQVGANIVGIVLTDVDSANARYGDYYYYTQYTYKTYFDNDENGSSKNGTKKKSNKQVRSLRGLTQILSNIRSIF